MALAGGVSSLERTNIDWNVVGDTQGASQLVDALGAQDVSQGSEVENTNADLRALLARNTIIIPTGPYNGDPGGSMQVREMIANDFWDSHRIMVDPEHAFASQTLGRSVIDEGYKIAAQSVWARAFGDAANGVAKPTRKPVVILEDLGWGLLDNLAYDNNLEVEKFSHFANDLVGEVENAIMRAGPENVATVVINRPLNPNGLETSVEEMTRFMQMMDRINEQYGTDIHVIFDAPYVFGCKVGEDQNGKYLKTGLENVLNGDWNTKWIFTNTMGKEVALAAHGAAKTAFSKTYPVKDFIKRSVNNGKGIARNDALITNVAHLLGNDEYRALKWANRAALRAKYNADDEILQSRVGGNLVPGGPNMLLRTLQYNKDDFIGQTYKGKYGEWSLNNVRDMVACLAHEFNVVPVAQPFNGAGFDHSIFVRVAKKNQPEAFGPAIESLQEGLSEMSGKSPDELSQLVDTPHLAV